LRPDWWAASAGSFSKMLIIADGSRRDSSRATVNPRIPAPTTATVDDMLCSTGADYFSD